MQKTAYEIGVRLVGSEMCIRDRPSGSVIGRTGYVAGGPTPWISKADAVLSQPAHHLAVTGNLTH